MECKNCHTSLSETAEYCHSCGGKIIRNRLTMRNLLEHFSETFFNYDNQFFQTLIDLIKKPWEVVESYVGGTRKRYISPLSFFAISLTISGIYVFLVKKYFMASFAMSYNYGNTPAKFGEDIVNATIEYYSLTYFLLIPGFALLSRIVFYNKSYNYTEHVVMFFYTMSLISIISSILTILISSIYPESMMVLVGIVYVLYFIYQTNLYKKLFNLSIKQLSLKVLLFIPLFFMAYVGISIVIFILMLLFGYVNLQDFAPPS